MTDVRIAPYRPEDSAQAIALERRSAQGKRFRVRFDRPWFHRRAENFADWHLVTAWQGDALVGIAGGALKPVAFRGRQTNALYYFDVRIAQELRRQGIAQKLVRALTEWGNGRAEIGYGYVIGDNRESIRMCTEWLGAAPSPACALLAQPLYRCTPVDDCGIRADPKAVHASYCRHSGPFDLYSDPTPTFAASGYVGSWLYDGPAGSAGCSAWSNAKIFAEVVEHVPLGLAMAGALHRRWPFRLLGGPPVPRPGERISSWYLFDVFAAGPAAAEALLDRVGGEARARGIDYCFVIHRPGAAWAGHLRARFPRIFAPVIPCAIVAGSADEGKLAIAAPYIDVRDV